MADQMKGHIETIENPQGADQENQRGDTTEKDITQEEDLEKEETATDIENPLTQDQGLTVDIVEIIPDPQADLDQMLIDQKPTEMREMKETKDTILKKIEKVILAMVAGAEKVARRP